MSREGTGRRSAAPRPSTRKPGAEDGRMKAERVIESEQYA
jgi:hypothetical protein